MVQRIFLLIFLLCFTFLLGCYTTLSHPPVGNTQMSHVYTGDDCQECHTQPIYKSPILPESAVSDYNWQFYSGSVWWQDESAIYDHSVSQIPEGTGARSFDNASGYSGPATMPVPGASVQSLSKSSGKKEQSTNDQQNEKKRSVKRRTPTTESESSKSTSRTKRN